jgi:outer membrane protein insertion porin family
MLMLINMQLFTMDQEHDDDPQATLAPAILAQKNNPIATKSSIRNIYVEGNEAVPTRAILEKVPFKPGDVFDQRKTGIIIRGIHQLNYFRNVQVMTEEIAPEEINLIIVVTEKNRISSIEYEGNSTLTKAKLDEKLDTQRIKAMDLEELHSLAQHIKSAYREKNYHHVEVISELVPDDKGTFAARFIIKEGQQSIVKQVHFKGNDHIADHYLRNRIVTKEDWILGFMDHSGFYHPGAIDFDKHTIENIYQSNGFMAARVTDTIVEETQEGCVSITFIIQEGDPYCIKSVSAPGNEILTEQQLLWRIPIRPGQFYSKELIIKTMEQLRMLWGNLGYIYADVQPSVRPNEKDKTVDITFNTDLGNKISVNRITISGNLKTRDNVIRREILFNEGDILTTYVMEESKRRVELLGFFDQKDGVTWKIIKLDEETADLELVLNEIKTGRGQLKMGFGPQGDAQSTTPRFSVGFDISDTNFRGNGITYHIAGSYSQQDKIFNISVGNRWLFDRPIYGGAEFHVRRTTYEDFFETTVPPIEDTIGGSGTLGFRMESLSFAQLSLAGGAENISYADRLVARPIPNASAAQQVAIQETINRRFQPGQLAWLGASLVQDVRNHPVYPTDGYVWNFNTQIGLPHTRGCFGYAKIELDGRWYTPLIQEYGVVLYLHGFAGFVHTFDGFITPYRELWHIGGPATVRGFKFGQIGPTLQISPLSAGSSLGATKAILATAELQFPITADGNMRGWFFYDGGSGWDTPPIPNDAKEYVRNNSFDFRHAIGFGFSMMAPVPIRLDWGFKLDQRKKIGEQLSEVHFTATQAF